MIALRSTLFAIWLFVGSAILSIVSFPLYILPRGGVRRLTRLWGAFVLFGLRWLCGIRVEVRGHEHVPTGPALIAAKHQSMLDICAQFTLLPDACFVMKKELLAIPFFGWYALKGRMIPVDREGHAAALKKLVADTQDRMRDDRQVVIFPEGTRTRPGEAPAYKPGVAALYRDLGLPCTLVATNSGQHWPAKGFARYPGVVVYEYLPPLPAGLKRGQFMAEMQERIETVSGDLLIPPPLGEASRRAAP
jgi:1-acyl-sn-glycerol-3-phosphate acyltransferase